MENEVPKHSNSPIGMGRMVGDRLNNLGHNNKNKKNKAKIITVVFSVILALGALLFGLIFLCQSNMGANIDSNKYQAVFLTNGQVYFGKLHTLTGGYMKLTDIYYLQTTAKDTSSSDLQAASGQSSTDVQLIKLGDEIHGPDDEMIISKDQVLFFENLKKDSKVSSSIVKYQNQKK